jgi:uncharacterized pyridoxal phosphate-dependent enzyme
MQPKHRLLGRRRFLSGAAWLSTPPALLAAAGLQEATASPPKTEDNVYSRLGVPTYINALGTVTRLGGCIMPPEVARAMEEAGQHFVPLADLHEKVGERIARLIGVEAATVTSGAAGAITVGTAACVTRGDPDKIAQLPDTAGMPNQVIIQKAHRKAYEAQVRVVGTKIVEVETTAQLEAAINPKTAMLFFINTFNPKGQIDRRTWVAMGKKHGVPTFNDAAADVPPKERLSEYVRMGFDLVTFSGGKGLLGPQCSGLLLGRKDLVMAARRSGSPWSGIGRGMKVGKEEMIGLLAAVERYLKVDHQAEKRLLQSRVATIAAALAPIRGVQAESFVPEIANHVPHLSLEWDYDRIPITSSQASGRLKEGNPPIEVGGHRWLRPKSQSPKNMQGLTVSVWMLRPGEDRIVAERLKSILAG